MPLTHYLFIALNVILWVSLYYANSRDPGFIPCHSPDYDMALKQVRSRDSSVYHLSGKKFLFCKCLTPVFDLT